MKPDIESPGENRFEYDSGRAHFLEVFYKARESVEQILESSDGEEMPEETLEAGFKWLKLARNLYDAKTWENAGNDSCPRTLHLGDTVLDPNPSSYRTERTLLRHAEHAYNELFDRLDAGDVQIDRDKIPEPRDLESYGSGAVYGAEQINSSA